MKKIQKLTKRIATAIAVGVVIMSSVGAVPVSAAPIHDMETEKVAVVAEMNDFELDVRSSVASALAKLKAQIYTYKGQTYYILANAKTYSGSKYCQFNSAYKKTFGNVGCSATACACAIAIMKNSHKNPANYWKKNVGCVLSYYGSVGTVTGSKAALKQCANLILQNKPGILQMTKGSQSHFVTVIGIKTSTNMNNVTTKDILVMDPANGKICTLAEALSYNGKTTVTAVRWFKSVK